MEFLLASVYILDMFTYVISFSLCLLVFTKSVICARS